MQPSATSRGIRPRDGSCLGVAAGAALRRRAAAHSPKFQAVRAPTTAANWWLLRVARQLRALNVRNSNRRIGLNRQAGSAVDVDVVVPALLAFFGRFGGLALPFDPLAGDSSSGP